MAKKVFQGDADEIDQEITAEGYEYAIPPGRRAPMHRMHIQCVFDILRAGLKPVLAIGSVNGPESKLWNPVKNPLTVEQQKEQFHRALPGVDYNSAMIIELEDTPDDKSWIENFHKKLKDLGIDGKSVVYFRAKSADAATAADAGIKPLAAYTQSFVDEGMAVWQSYNTDPADDNISASAIRAFDLNNLTVEQKRIIGAPGYIIQLAREARNSNPDKALLEENNIPLTVLDLSFDRMRKEAGISTAAVIELAKVDGPVDVASLSQAATDLIRERAGATISKARKPLVFMSNSVSDETAEAVRGAGLFSLGSASIGKFQSDEPFVELFYMKRDGDKNDQKLKEELKKYCEANREKVKGNTVYILGSMGEPVAEHMVDILLMTHTAKQYGAKEVVVVSPFLALSREDREFDEGLWSIGTDFMAGQLKAAKADKVVTFTMHSQAGVAAYKKEFGDNFIALDATDVFTRYLEGIFRGNAPKLITGAPDGADKLKDEGQRRARELSTSLTGAFNEKSMFFIAKRHTGTNKTEIDLEKSKIEVEGQDCVIIDDLIDGGGTAVNAATELKKRGAKSVTVLCTHGILTPKNGTALEKLMTTKIGDAYTIDRFAVTDSIPEAKAKIKTFRKQYPELADRVDWVSLGPAIVGEIKRQMAAEAAPANSNAPGKPKVEVLKVG